VQIAAKLPQCAGRMNRQPLRELCSYLHDNRSAPLDLFLAALP
jgi:hypothetical protein